ncbi:YncE family protein [Bacteroides sp.]
MKRILSIVTLSVLLAGMSACQGNKQQQVAVERDTVVVNDGLRFCESTYPYQGGVLIANFGTEQLNPLNTEGKGYIMQYKDGKTSMLIPADGNLSAPKGMYLKGEHLFICDVNKVVVYNLNDLKAAPQTIRFPEDDLFINDLVASGDTLYASVTNTGRIYSIGISNLTTLNNIVPVKWTDIAGPNGLLLDDKVMYVASYPADGNTTEANVIYRITDWNNPVPEVFVNIPGQYDGIALSADKKTMYVTNWSPAGISAIDMQTRQFVPLTINLKEPLVGAADITVTGDMMYIPDLPNSRVIVLPL